MHQSGHCRAQSMQTVQFSSLRAMTPRARAGGSSRSWGYCTVTAGFIIVRKVTPRPETMPGSLGLAIRKYPVPSEDHLEDAGGEDVQERQGDEVLPGDRLQLVLAEPGVGEAHPEDEERDQHHLGEQHDRP